MAYSDDSLKAKLSTLSEAQDSIVAVSQWITFYRRYADKIASVWLTRLRDSQPQKRLNYLYLVNDIVQNAKARKRTEFPNAFAPLMAEAVQQAYKSATSDIQNKIKRLTEVWKSRNVFEESILRAIQDRLDEVDKGKNPVGPKKTLMGNSLFASSGVPKELETLSPLQNAVTKATLTSKPLVETAQAEEVKLRDASTPKPSAPVYAASLSSLVKKLASAEASLNESIEARKKLIADLKRVLEQNEVALKVDERTQLELVAKRSTAEADKRDVEDNIMRGLASTTEDEGLDTTASGLDYSRPDVEELTPEPDSFTEKYEAPPPDRNPALQGILAGFGAGSAPSYSTRDTIEPGPPNSLVRAPSNDFEAASGSNKRAKLSHDEGMDQVPDFGSMGFDLSSAQNYQGSTTIEQDVDDFIYQAQQAHNR